MEVVVPVHMFYDYESFVNFAPNSFSYILWFFVPV